MIRSRLNRRLEEKTKKNLVLNILGIVLVILLVLKFGIPLLVNLSVFFSGSSKNNQMPVATSIQDTSFIAPPVLDSFPDATSSANIPVSGIASKNQSIDLYINGNLQDNTKTKDDGSFLLTETLRPGENTIQVKAVVNGKESDFSNSITTAFKSAPPSLNVTSPSDGQSYSKDQNTATVMGTTDPDVKVTVNGFWAISDDNGNFSYNLPLQNGDNQIKVVATDAAGNTTEKDIKVTYSS